MTPPILTPPPVGVVAVNGTGYVHAMLSRLEQGIVTVPLRNAGDGERIDRLGIETVITPEAGGGWVGGSFRSPVDDQVAMISFTSGTEGQPKAVYLSRANLHDVVQRLTGAMEITDEIREYIGVPVYHSFGYGRCRIVLNAGGDCYLPGRGFDLLEIRRMLQQDEINAISAVPSLWRIFLRERDLFGPELEKVRWVEIGSQFMAAEEKLALREALPNARIVQHYGLTEASRTSLLRIDQEPPEALGSVGRALGAVEIRISPEDRIEIRGPHVAMGVGEGDGYRAMPAGSWLTTSDRGRLEGGLLWFEGRADDVINCGGIKISPDLAEAQVRQRLPAAGDFGLLRRPDPLRGEKILLALAPDAVAQRAGIQAAVGAYAAGLGLEVAGAIEVREVASLPRTLTGKLQRSRLAEMLDAEPVPAPAAEAPAGGGFMGLLQELLGPGAAEPGATYQGLGGDSLAHMQMTLALERALGGAPPDWEWTPLAELAARVDAAGDLAELMAGSSGSPPLPRGDRNMNPEGISFWSLVAEDFRSNGSDLFHQGFLMLLVHRFGNWRMGVRPKLLRMPLTLLYRILNKLTEILFGMKLSYTVKVGRRVRLEHFGGMILGAREIGNDVILRQNTTMGIRTVADLNGKPVLGDGVDVGAGAVIVGNIHVGDNAIIGANSVVFTNVPPNAVVMGVPARIIGTRR